MCLYFIIGRGPTSETPTIPQNEGATLLIQRYASSQFFLAQQSSWPPAVQGAAAGPIYLMARIALCGGN